MYAPSEFSVTDSEVLVPFLEANPFGLLLINGNEGFPVASQLPFLVKRNVNSFHIEAHIALANPQSTYLKDGKMAKWIVQGAHGYVSSSVYTHTNVPTYNYETVYTVGTIEVMQEDELLVHLSETVNQFELGRKKMLSFDQFPKEMINSYTREILGFRFIPFRIAGVFKLSQNRNDIDFQRIIDDLNQGTIQQRAVAQAMEKWKKNQ